MLGPWMGFMILFFQFLEGGVGIDLCRCQTGVPQELLHRLKVGLMIEHCSGKRVTEYVRAPLLLHRHEPQLCFHHPSDAIRLEALALTDNEESLLILAFQEATFPYIY